MAPNPPPPDAIQQQFTKIQSALERLINELRELRNKKEKNSITQE